ncbi:MAG: chitobiase/beta-hexosaminidase C-terminal domain-containing protein, partial [Muribaculum sp.]|nr:chitobiase/beta-hexosaminidase C-terminal domain-containing protein [Muribaculum sp.]
YIAVKEGHQPSEVISVTITGELRKTTINEHFSKPAEKEYEINEEVKFLRDKDVKIYYTINGSVPSIPDQKKPTVITENIFNIDKTPLIYRGENINLKFIAKKEGFAPSDIIQMEIKGELLPTELNVHFWKPEEKQYMIHEIVVFKRDPDVKIYYTTDGSKPKIADNSGSEGKTYDLDISPLTYEGEQINVKFIGCKSGRKASETITVTINGEPRPTTQLNSHFYILKESGYKFKEEVRIDRLGEVKIYYTLDGSDPVIPSAGVVSPTTYDFDYTPIVYMGHSITLKLVAVKEGMLPSVIISLTLTGEDIPSTTIDQHFMRPTEKVYALHEEIMFNRDADVKIYYTLDGQEPIVPDAKSIIPQGTIDGHTGQTYDLDQRPLTYEGIAMMIKFVAVKEDYMPSEVYTYYIGDDASALPLVQYDSDSQSEYYNINGIRIQYPTQPGIYIVRQGRESRKIFIQ